jgi:hypothetical protein
VRQQFEDQTLEQYINYARRQILDLAQSACTNSDSWSLLRRRILQVFGQNGFGRYTNNNKERSNEHMGSNSKHQKS